MKEWKPTIEPTDPQLIIAVKQNNLNRVIMILKQEGFLVNEIDDMGYTALHWAVLILLKG